MSPLFSAVVTKECLVDKPAKTIIIIAVSSCLKLIKGLQQIISSSVISYYFRGLQHTIYITRNIRDEALRVEVHENSFVGSHADLRLRMV